MTRVHPQDGRQTHGARCSREAVRQPPGGRPTNGRPGINVLGGTCDKSERRKEMAAGGAKDKRHDERVSE